MVVIIIILSCGPFFYIAPAYSWTSVCVCVCVCARFLWFMRRQIGVMTWVLHWYYDVNMKYEDISWVFIFKIALKTY